MPALANAWPRLLRSPLMRRRGRATLASALVIVLFAAAAGRAAAADPVVAAAGDIACQPGAASDVADCHQQQTAQLVVDGTPDMVLALGDGQYESGALTEFQRSFGPSWGRFKPSIRPVPGNHEYGTAGAAGYFTYFGAVGNRPYYSFDVGSWHLIALNSNCTSTQCGDNDLGVVSTTEVTWLQNDLAAHRNMCTLAYWHHPLFTSAPPGNSSGVKPFWDALYAGRADLVLNGHSHDYERFKPQNPSGGADANGITEIIAGTGGKDLASATVPHKANSVAQSSSSFGALFLTLHPSGYDWAFRREDGTTLDSGSAACHSTGGVPPPTASFTSSPAAPQTGVNVGFDGGGSSDPLGSGLRYSWDFGDGRSGSGTTASHSYARAGTYSVRLTVTDGNNRTNSTTHSVTIGNRPPAASFAFSPASPLTGDNVGFDGSGSSDPDGSVVGYTWDFGDGTTDYGKTTSHVYEQPGTYSVQLTATDDGDQTNTATRTVTVGARPVPVGAQPQTASFASPPAVVSIAAPNRPRILAFSMSRSAFRVVGAGSRAGTRGSGFRFSLSERANAKITAYSQLSGRLDGRRCRAPTRRLRHKPRCTRQVALGALLRSGRKGANEMAFSGRLGHQRLAPGRYLAVMTATNAAGKASQAKTVRFTILAG